MRATTIGALVVLQVFLSAGMSSCDGPAKIDARISRPNLPAVPPYIVNCFQGVVDFSTVDTSPAGVARAMTKIRKSEAYKDACGKRAIAWYNSVKAAYGSK